MKVTRTGSLTALGLAGAMLLSACGSDNGAKATNGQKNVAKGDCAGGSLSGAGSTFQANMESQWAKDFAAKCSGAQVNYQSVGSGAGIEQFGAGTVDFGG
ncbi:MAG: substrate-binding domain-containing protein, partial [Mycobacteriales bacterium]